MRVSIPMQSGELSTFTAGIFSRMRNTGRTCGICGAALMTLVVVNDTLMERCAHSGVTVCSEPRVEWLHGHTPEPDGPPMARPVYVLGTSTATASMETYKPIWVHEDSEWVP